MNATNVRNKHREWQGMALALVGVVIFAGTLPATRVAVAWFDPWWVGCARAVGAGALGALTLWLTGSPRPARRHWRAIALTSAGVVLGFPLLTSLAMQVSHASHAAIVIAVLPFATALMAAWRLGERKPARFWIGAALGSLVVLVFALYRSGGRPGLHDLILLAAVAAAALGYAEGGRLAGVFGGWQSISWALIAAAPLMLPATAWLAFRQPFGQIPLGAWAAFGYVTVFSQWLGFLFWYGGMQRAGVAAASQVQLLQLFFSLAIAAIFLGEQVGVAEWATAASVIGLILWGRMPGKPSPAS
ncbi:MAG TPA: DMT family transporter [Burkholderiaceae bacterium]|jgi:drug/metabolite transporter (DMT)-like permease|nr:DMT family transporter [Burkholderiaceae bacterium]